MNITNKIFSRNELARKAAFTTFLERFCQTFNDVMQYK